MVAGFCGKIWKQVRRRWETDVGKTRFRFDQGRKRDREKAMKRQGLGLLVDFMQNIFKKITKKFQSWRDSCYTVVQRH